MNGELAWIWIVLDEYWTSKRYTFDSYFRILARWWKLLLDVEFCLLTALKYFYSEKGVNNFEYSANQSGLEAIMIHFRIYESRKSTLHPWG